MAEMGRPTDYTPLYCEQVIELGRAGKSVTQIAAELDVNRDTIYEWIKVHPDFSDAITRSKQLAQAWWENAGQNGLTMPGFNASLWAKQVSCRFREDYAETSKHEITGKNGGPIETKRIQDMTDDELAAIAAGSGGGVADKA
jgi:transposase-like protein